MSSGRRQVPCEQNFTEGSPRGRPPPACSCSRGAMDTSPTRWPDSLGARGVPLPNCPCVGCLVAEGQGQVLEQLEKPSLSLSSGGDGQGMAVAGTEVSSASKRLASKCPRQQPSWGRDDALAQSPRPEAGAECFLNTNVCSFVQASGPPIHPAIRHLSHPRLREGIHQQG